jgi:hypothetical protein
VSGPSGVSDVQEGILHNLGQTTAVPGSEQSGLAPGTHATGSSMHSSFVLHLPAHSGANVLLSQSHHPSATNASHPKFGEPKMCLRRGEGSDSTPAKVPPRWVNSSENHQHAKEDGLGGGRGMSVRFFAITLSPIRTSDATSTTHPSTNRQHNSVTYL